MNKRKLKKFAKKKGLPMPFVGSANRKKYFKTLGQFPLVKKLTGGQAKLDKNKNNKLDAQDFKILRAEKAKGRGMGLQDEKMKPGKVMKAKRGKLVPLKKDPTKAISSVKPSAGGKGSGTTNLGNPRKKGDPFLERRMKLAGAKSLIGKGGRIGAAAAMLGLAGAGAASLGITLSAKDYTDYAYVVTNALQKEATLLDEYNKSAVTDSDIIRGSSFRDVRSMEEGEYARYLKAGELPLVIPSYESLTGQKGIRPELASAQEIVTEELKKIKANQIQGQQDLNNLRYTTNLFESAMGQIEFMKENT